MDPLVGLMLGIDEGVSLGLLDGARIGPPVGSKLGKDDGIELGSFDGAREESLVGF